MGISLLLIVEGRWLRVSLEGLLDIKSGMVPVLVLLRLLLSVGVRQLGGLVG